MNRRCLRPAILCFAFATLGLIDIGPLAGAARAQQNGEVLFGALILATNAERPEPAPESIRAQAENLRKIFGYNQFRILGEKHKIVPHGREDWLVTSRQFFLRVDTRSPVVGGYALGLQLVQEDRVLVEAEVIVRRDRPLFIRGPFTGTGQLLILLSVL